MFDRCLPPRTVQYTYAALHRGVRQAARRGMIPRNPCDDIDPTKVSREKRRPLDRKQTRQLLNTARFDGDRLETLWVVAIHTGMRPRELLGLKWENVELKVGALRVRRTLSHEGMFAAPKTGPHPPPYRDLTAARKPSGDTARRNLRSFYSVPGCGRIKT